MRKIQPISGACVWHGSEMAGSARWQRRLSQGQVAEIGRHPLIPLRIKSFSD